jgi:hypothetical protein
MVQAYSSPQFQKWQVDLIVEGNVKNAHAVVSLIVSINGVKYSEHTSNEHCTAEIPVAYTVVTRHANLVPHKALCEQLGKREYRCEQYRLTMIF